ncbi:MAG: choice-of-anchor D domain-containing protein [Solirubrobacterales bacterium]|nr:choice-of-anchor D domain-containing protein [Solirubrobacterales bacterium]
MRGSLLALVAAVLMVAPQGASALKFTPATGSPITDSGNPISMSAAGDLNEDGRDDIAFGVSGVNGFKVKLAQANGTFTDAHPGGLAFGTGPNAGSVSAVYIADVNDDGDLDVLVTVSNRNWQLYLGDGSGQFGADPDSTFAVPYTEAPRFMQPAAPYPNVIADVDDDGDQDIVAGMYDFAFDVILNDGDGNFAPQPITYFADQATRGQFDAFGSVAVGDWDGDGNVDLALAMRRDGGVVAPTGVYVAEGNGDGTFTPDGGAPLLSGPMAPQSIATIRLDADSRDDLIVGMSDNSGGSADNVFTLLGSASGLVENSASGGSLNAGYGPYQVGLADLDHDSRTDVLVGVRGSGKATAIKNVGDGTIAPFAGSPFVLPTIDGNNFAVNAIYGGDFNGDGVADIAADSSHSGQATQARGIDILISQPDASPSPSSVDFGMVVPGQSSSPQSVTIANAGAAPAIPAQNITITGADADQFSLGATTCGGGQIPGNDSCIQAVTFSPTSGGDKSATLRYAMSNQADIAVPLTGKGGEPELTVPSGLTHLGTTFKGDTSSVRITLESTGTGPVTIGTPSVFNNPGQSEFFSIVNDECAGETIAPDATCTLDIHFTPTTVGFKGTSIMIPSSDPAGGGTQAFGVDGVGIDPGISVTPTSHDFGSVEMGMYGTPKTKTFTISSTGTTNLSAFPISIEGDDSDDFTFVGSPSCSVVTPGNSCPVEVRFAPESGASGARSAELVIENNTRDDNELVIPLTGTATAAHVTPHPTSIQFGEVDPYDGTPPAQTLELESDGTADMIAAGYFGDLEGPPNFTSGPFSVNGAACMGTQEDPVTTSPGESCDLTVTFDPSNAAWGANTETLHVLTNGNSVDVPLSATLTRGGASVSTESVDLGDVEVGQTGSATVTVTSTGTAPLKLDAPAINGPDADMFSVDQPASCTGLTEDQTCEVTVEFTPSAIAGKQAWLTLSGNFGSANVALAGRGIAAYVNAPSEIAFGETVVGTEISQTSSLISNGDAPFTLGSLTVEGADASAFSVKAQDGGCSGLVRGEECEFTVTYRPTSAGTHHADLKVAGNLETQTIPLSGSARGLNPAKLSLKLSGPKKVKRGKVLVLTAKIANSGQVAATGVVLRAKLPKKLAKTVKPIRIPSVAAGKKVTRKIKVRVKKTAKKGKKLRVKVTAAAKGVKPAAAARVTRIR